MTKKSDQLVQQKFKGRVETYYVMSKQNLTSLGLNSFVGDFLFLIGTVLIGIYYSEGPRLSGMLGLIAIFVSFAFYVKKFWLIYKTTKSDEIDFLNPSDQKLKIIKASWASESISDDVTAIVSGLVVDNKKLFTPATIDVFGDPHGHHYKFLTIEYQLGDNEPQVLKVKEGAFVAIPR